MDLYVLGEVSWWESQSYYHALAELGREGLVLCSPNESFVCLGVHDDLSQELDTAYCQQHGIHVLRRKIGGGIVLLDGDQFFYQVVLKKSNKMVPMRRELLFERMLQPAIHVYEQMGMLARWKAPADLICGGKKCTGSGAGEIGDCVALSGNVLLNFDYATMARVLKSPNEMFTQALEKSMRDNMCTVVDFEIDPVPLDLVTDWLCGAFEKVFGELQPVEIDDELRQQALACKEALTAPEWLQKPGRKTAGRRVKIKEGVYLNHVKRGQNEYIIQTRDDQIEEFYVLKDGETHREKAHEGQPYDSF